MEADDRRELFERLRICEGKVTGHVSSCTEWRKQMEEAIERLFNGMAESSSAIRETITENTATIRATVKDTNKQVAANRALIQEASMERHEWKAGRKVLFAVAAAIFTLANLAIAWFK